MRHAGRMTVERWNEVGEDHPAHQAKGGGVMGIPVTRVDPPKPGFVRLKESFGSIRFSERHSLDLAVMSAQVGDQYCGVEVGTESNGPGPGDFNASEVVEMLRAFADRIEKLASEQ